MNRIALGKKGEEISVTFLARHGYRLVERNYRCIIGEIDIVAIDGDTLVFIEVRTRSSNRYGTPAESITQKKRVKLRRLAQHYLQYKPEHAERKIRFDFIGVNLEHEQQPIIEHLHGVF